MMTSHDIFLEFLKFDYIIPKTCKCEKLAECVTNELEYSHTHRDENKWLILEGRGRMKIPTLSEKSFIRPVNLLYLPN